MAVFHNEKRPWLDDDPEIEDRLWVDKKQEEIAKILPKEGCVDRIPIRCHNYWVPCVALVLSLLIAGRSGFLVPFDIVLRYWTFLLALVAIFWPLEAFIFRNAWGYIEIYSEMFVIYEYNSRHKNLYLAEYYSWKDVTRYDHGMDGIRIDFVSGQYVCFKAKKKEFYPYLLRYAPQAKKLTREERKLRAKAQQQEQKKRKEKWKKENAEYLCQIKEYNAKKKALIEEARRKAQQEQEKNHKKDLSNL